MKRTTSAWAVAGTLLAAPAAYADSCYEQYNNGSVDCAAQNSTPRGAAQAPRPSAGHTALRDQLKRALSEAHKTDDSARDAERLQGRVLDARGRAQAAFDDPGAPGARQRYEDALRDLRAAYDEAARTFPDKSAAIADAKKTDEAYAASEAARVGWIASAPAAAATEPPTVATSETQAMNVGVGPEGHVFVCDGPVDAPRVSCREIQHDGRQCLAVIAFDSQVNWRDATTTPCTASDLEQADRFLAEHRDLGAQVGVARMSDRCADLANDFFSAANANDAPGARAAYVALKDAGGCGLLAYVKPPAAPASPDIAVLDIGRQIGVMLGKTVSPMAQTAAPVQATRAVPAVAGAARTYGQGGPARIAPASNSTITGLGGSGGGAEGSTTGYGTPPTAATVRIDVPAQRANAAPSTPPLAHSGGSSMQGPQPAVRGPSIDTASPAVSAPTVNVTAPTVHGATVNESGPTVRQPNVAVPRQLAAALANPVCMPLLKSYVSAAQSGDGPAAAAAYDALKQAGGCGVLDQVASQANAAPSDPRFVSRGTRPMLEQTAAACDQQQAACAQVINQLRAGTSSEATAALYSNAISIGLSLGSAMGSALVPVPTVRTVGTASQPDMRSLAAPRIRSTYGQGSPTKIAPVSKPSTITGFGQQ